MDRDMEVIKKIILAVKESDKFVTKVEGIPDDLFKFNAALLIESGLVLGKEMPSSKSNTQIPFTVIVFRLTWDGFEFAELVKDETLWEKAKKHVLKPASGWTFSVLLEYLKQEAMAKLQ